MEKTKSGGRDGFSLERSTDNENAISRVGSPFEGPNDVFEQVRQGNSGIAHMDNQNKNNNKSLQTQIRRNHDLISKQQKLFQTLIDKVDSLSKLVSTPTSADNDEYPSKTCYESTSDSDSEVDGDRESRSDTTFSVLNSSDLSEVRETRKMLIKLGGDCEKSEGLGTEVDHNLAQVVDAGITQPIDRKLATSLCKKQLRPANCTTLLVPKLNKEIWTTSSLLKNIKENDKRFQTAQGYLTAGLIPLVNLMDCLLKTNQYKEFELAKDSFQLLLYAHRDVTNLRRQHIRPGLNERYRQLCNDATPLTNNMLGDDLEVQLKSMDVMRKLGKYIMKGKKNVNPNKRYASKRDYKGFPVNRSTSYQPHSNRPLNKDHFLGKKSRQQNPLPAERKPNRMYRK